MRKCFVHTLALLVLLGLVASPAKAEPIRTVTSGQVIIGVDGGPFTLSGDGFTLTGATASGESLLFECTPCIPADRITLSLSSKGFGIAGAAQPGTFEGTDYASTNLSAVFIFTSSDFTSFVLPPGEQTRSAPFTFYGELLDFASREDALNGTSPQFFGQFSGTGIATAHFTSPAPGQLFAQNITYDFLSATPEPASLLLCAPAAAWLFARRARRDRSQ